MKKIKKIAISFLILNSLAFSVVAACESTYGSGSYTCGLVDTGSKYCFYVCSDGKFIAVGKPKAFDEPAMEEGLVF